jgi:hypothetical protein
MAITFNTDRLQGLSGVTVNGVYARIQSIIVKKYDASTNPDTPVQWKCLYDVILYASAEKRNASGESPGWPNRLNSSEIDHFTCTYDPTSNSSPYDQVYADLKTRLASGDSPIATGIVDA